MKITYICGSLPFYDHGVSKIIQTTQTIFTELGVETHTTDLSKVHPQYYEGETHTAIDPIMEEIKSSDGVVFACTSQLFAPNALMQSFLEYFIQPEYSEILQGKCCFFLVTSKNGGEKSALSYMSKIVQHFGGYDRWQIGLQADLVLDMTNSPSLKAIVERETEDFYRAVNQGRQYIIPQDIGISSVEINTAKPTDNLPTIDSGVSAPTQDRQILEVLNEQQEKEIDELSRLFSQKYSTPAPKPTLPPIEEPPLEPLDAIGTARRPQLPTQPSSPPRSKSAQQITQSLPHYFQPQLSAGLQAVVQINITGEENFDGFLYIHGTECSYTEGEAPAPDIIIMADTSVWMDVLKNKQTAQKAFMMGGLKVRGDFVLLTKFDNLFKLD